MDCGSPPTRIDPRQLVPPREIQDLRDLTRYPGRPDWYRRRTELTTASRSCWSNASSGKRQCRPGKGSDRWQSIRCILSRPARLRLALFGCPVAFSVPLVSTGQLLGLTRTCMGSHGLCLRAHAKYDTSSRRSTTSEGTLPESRPSASTTKSSVGDSRASTSALCRLATF